MQIQFLKGKEIAVLTIVQRLHTTGPCLDLDWGTGLRTIKVIYLQLEIQQLN